MAYKNAEQRIAWGIQVIDKALGKNVYDLESKNKAISLGKGAPSLNEQLDTYRWLDRLLSPAKKGTDLVKSMYQ
jgi:hypothetical protein